MFTSTTSMDMEAHARSATWNLSRTVEVARPDHISQPNSNIPKWIEAMTREATKGLIVVISLIGFLVQVTQMSALYFGYHTTTRVTYVLNNEITPHSLVVCVRFTDILDRVKLKKDTGIEVDDVTDMDEALTQQAKLTVKQVFDCTPKSHEVLDGCFIRTSDLRFTTHTAAACKSMFNVSRYMTQEFMCYILKPVAWYPVHTDAATLSHFKQFTVYDLLLKPVFASSYYVIPITFLEGYPYVSRSFTDVLTLKKVKGNERLREYNLINISPTDYQIKTLEKPYETACIDRDPDEVFDCKRDCLLQEFEKYNRIPLTEILKESESMFYDMFPITTIDLEDPEFERLVNITYSRCHDDCFFRACSMSYTKTTVRTLVLRDFPLILAAMSPTKADVRTESQATMTFVEYFSFICDIF